MANTEKKDTAGQPSMVDQIIHFDILDNLQDVMGKRYIIPPDTGKLTEIEPLRTIGYEDPWIYTNPDPCRHCHFYTMITDRMKYVHPGCMKCWKVVARPRTLLETFQMLRMQELMAKEDKECWCKIGMEVRPHVFGNWGAYFYNDSLEQGREKWKWVRAMVDEHVSPDVGVILKRGCTEMERQFGSTLEWDKKYKDTPRVQAWERVIEQAVEQPKKPETLQPDFVKKHVMAKWIAFAWDRGDPTVITLNNGVPLLPPLVTYHDDLEKEYRLTKMKDRMKEQKEKVTDEIK
jgi:hypothetical protein